MINMRFYLASSFKRKDDLEEIREELEIRGHVVPDIWWHIDSKKEGPANDREWYSTPFIQGIALRHWKAIQDSDALILVGSPSEQTTFNGALIELGYAISKGIPCFSYGIFPRSAMYCPVVNCLNIHELINVIEIFSLKER